MYEPKYDTCMQLVLLCSESAAPRILHPQRCTWRQHNLRVGVSLALHSRRRGWLLAPGTPWRHLPLPPPAPSPRAASVPDNMMLLQGKAAPAHGTPRGTGPVSPPTVPLVNERTTACSSPSRRSKRWRGMPGLRKL